jgi:ribose-phosphate pyrophosphokinase
MKLLSANSNPLLAKAIADHLDTPLAQAEFKRFKDNEIFVEIQGMHEVKTAIIFGL